MHATTLADPERTELVEALMPYFRRERRELSDEEFNDLALRVFRFQYSRCAPFAQLCRASGIDPAGGPSRYTEIPCAPTDAFKFYRMACFPPCAAEIVFQTSGTSQARSGLHHMPGAEIYDAAALPWFAENLLESDRRYRFISLTDSPEAAPRSSLVHMIAAAARRFGAGGRATYCIGASGVDINKLRAALASARAGGEPVALMTTAFALVNCLEGLDGLGEFLALPPGSRVMETGGYKGRSRELSRADLYGQASRAFEISPRAIINEYGMTEMSSQYYDRTDLSALDDPAAPRVKQGPPWVRARVVDPASLEEVAHGEVGMLLHVDLANIDSCAFLRSSDAARRVGEGFELLGRFDQAEARGCSLDYETASA